MGNASEACIIDFLMKRIHFKCGLGMVLAVGEIKIDIKGINIQLLSILCVARVRTLRAFIIFLINLNFFTSRIHDKQISSKYSKFYYCKL